MRRFLALVLVIGLSGFGLTLAAQQQQQPGDQPNSQQEQQPGEQPGSQQPQADANGAQAPQVFQGKIARAGDQLVFQDSSQSAFQLDDQKKVAPFEGKTVKLTATVDAKTNTLHVIEVAPAGK